MKLRYAILVASFGVSVGYAQIDLQVNRDQVAAIEKEQEIASQFTAIKNLVKNNDLLSARPLLKNLESELPDGDPNLKDVLLTRARVEFALHNQAEAIILLNRWLIKFDDQPEAAEVYFMLGQTYRNGLAYDRAQENFYQTMNLAVVGASKQNQVDLESFKGLTTVAAWEIAETEYQRKKWERAAELFARFRAQNPETKQLSEASLFREADCYYQLADAKNAIPLYEEAINKNPQHPFVPESFLRLVELSFKNKDRARAEKYLEYFVMLIDGYSQKDLDYWTERCSQVLLRTAEDSNTREAMMKVLSNYHLAGNLQNQSGSPASRDDWNSWTKNSIEMQKTLEQKVQEIKPFN